MSSQPVSHVGRRTLSSVKSFMKQLTERKPMIKIQAEIDTQIEFRRTLNWVQLLGIGIGCMIGK